MPTPSVRRSEAGLAGQRCRLHPAPNLTGVRAGTIIAAGLAGMGYATFAPAMLAVSTVYYGWHVLLG